MTIVSRKAVVARINRVLAKEGEMLRTPRSASARYELGDYFSIDVRSNGITGKHFDLETLGREVGALREGESVSDA